jgi:hypothetical protein
MKLFVAASVLMAAVFTADAALAAQVTIHNPSWNHVTVEIRVGNGGDCPQNAPYGNGTFQLTLGGSLPVTTNGEDVCWRREADPDHPNGAWTDWTRQSVGSPTSAYDVNL